MGLGGIGIWQLLILLAIIALVFGTKRLKGIGGDLGGAIKGFKESLQDDSNKDSASLFHESAKADINESPATNNK
jgi:sec-independent protein translocase protein TatA